MVQLAQACGACTLLYISLDESPITFASLAEKSFFALARLVHHLTIMHTAIFTSNLTSHTLHKERKGLVMLQPLSCCQGMQLSNTAIRL